MADELKNHIDDGWVDAADGSRFGEASTLNGRSNF
jgi:hypothetical protein